MRLQESEETLGSISRASFHLSGCSASHPPTLLDSNYVPHQQIQAHVCSARHETPQWNHQNRKLTPTRKEPGCCCFCSTVLYRPHMAGYRPSVSEGGAMVVLQVRQSHLDSLQAVCRLLNSTFLNFEREVLKAKPGTWAPRNDIIQLKLKVKKRKVSTRPCSAETEHIHIIITVTMAT